MRIAVNTRLLLKDKLEGIGWFTFETLKRITHKHPDHEFVFLFDRTYSNEFVFGSNVRPLVVGPQTRHPLLWYVWLEYSLPGLFKSLRPDLFLSPDGFLSLSSPVRQLPVIHDLNFEHHPKDFPALAIRFFKHYFPRYARKAGRIATVSEYSRKDIIQTYGISADKIDVVYDGASEIFKPAGSTEKEQARAKYAKGHNYFLFVGALSPRKNVARLLQAFDTFRSKSTTPFKMVIAGEKMWKTAEIDRVLEKMKHRSDVEFTGRLQQHDLHQVMAGAHALVFVPYFEGFGIPMVEAMYCDVPVIASNLTSMPEIAGQAAELVDPYSIDSIALAMLKMSMDESHRNRLIENGKTQRLKFSWDKTSDRLWNSIETLL